MLCSESQFKRKLRQRVTRDVKIYLSELITCDGAVSSVFAEDISSKVIQKMSAVYSLRIPLGQISSSYSIPGCHYHTTAPREYQLETSNICFNLGDGDGWTLSYDWKPRTSSVVFNPPWWPVIFLFATLDSPILPPTLPQ